MQYTVILNKRALKDLRTLDKAAKEQIIAGIEGLEDDLAGDVKKLANFTPNYRLRVGVYRILFDIVEDTVTVYRVRHRKDVYRK